jgi:hypothetical protein
MQTPNCAMSPSMRTWLGNSACDARGHRRRRFPFFFAAFLSLFLTVPILAVRSSSVELMPMRGGEPNRSTAGTSIRRHSSPDHAKADNDIKKDKYSPGSKMPALQHFKAWLWGRVDAVTKAFRTKSDYGSDDYNLAKILRTMAKTVADSTQQLETCKSLLNFSKTAQIKAKIVESGGLEKIMNAMKFHPGNASIQCVALETLKSLAVGVQNNAVAIAEAEGINLTITAMIMHKDVSNVQQFACEVLKVLSVNHGITRKIIQNKGIIRIADAMAFHNEQSGVQEQASEALWQLAADTGDEINEIKIHCPPKQAMTTSTALAEGIESVIAVMNAHRGLPVLQQFACWAVSTLAMNDNNSRKIRTAGGIKSIIAVMKAHHTDAKVQRFGCLGLAKLAENEENLIEIKSEGGIGQIVSALDTHMGGDADVEASTCAALRAFSRRDVECQAQIISAGGVERLLGAMESQKGDASLQQSACDALFHLAHGTENLVQIASAGGIDSMLRAIQIHKDVLELQVIACKGLARLATNSGTVGRFSDNGGIDVLIESMARNQGEAAVQEYVCGVFGYLAREPDCHVLMVERGVIEHVLTAMEAHNEAAEMQTCACAALWALATHSENHARIGSAGCIERIVRTMGFHPGSEDLQFWACMALEELVRFDDNKAKILQVHGEERIVKAMDRHQNDSHLQYSACQTLRLLADNPTSKAKIGACGGIRSIIECMLAHSAWAELQVQACGALWTLSEQDTRNIGRILKAGGTQCITDIMDIHVGQPDVQAQACRVLWYLARDQPMHMRATDKLARCREQQRRQAGKNALVSKTMPSVVSWYAGKPSQGKSTETTKGELEIGIDIEASVESILTAMSTHKTRANVQYFSCAALGALAKNADAAIHSVIKHGGILRIAEAMKRHQDNLAVQLEASEALWQLALDADKELKASTLSVLKLSEGLGDIIKIMNSHSCRSSRRLQHFTIWTMWALASNEARAAVEITAATHAKAKAKAEAEAAEAEIGVALQLRARAEAAVLTAAEKQRGATESKAKANSDPEVQIAEVEEQAAMLVTVDAEARARAATENHRAACEAKQRADDAVSAAGAAEAKGQDCIKILKAGGIESIMAAIDHHHMDQELLVLLISALEALARHGDNLKRISTACGGAVERILTLMDKHMAEADIVMPACLLLRQLASSYDDDTTIMSQKGIGKLGVVIQTYLEQSWTQQPFSYLLSQYATVVKAIVEKNPDYINGVYYLH